MKKETNVRLVSLDTLRGFDMFWITGGEELIHVGAKVTGWGWLAILSAQFQHPKWNGLSVYDCIFPLFIFMAGVSTPFSYGSRLEKNIPRKQLLKKAVIRGFILVFLGIVYNNGLFAKEIGDMRFPSVLGRIGLAGMFSQIIYIYLPSAKKIIGVIIGILLMYWCILLWVPVPGCNVSQMTMECNPASYLDRMIIPGRLHVKIHDPEGLLSTLPAIATGLLGILAGMLLREKSKLSPSNKAARLILSGVITLIIGLLWSKIFPLNKNLWTSSFVLTVGGISYLLLAIFYWVIDVKMWRKWTVFFVVIGMNSIVIYMLSHFVDIAFTADAIFGGILSHFNQSFQEISKIVAYIAVQWILMYILYKQKWFLKI